MKTAITVRLDDDLEQLLNEVVARSGRNRSEIIRDALRRQLATLAFEKLHEQIMPFAEACGYLTDEGVFRDIS